jgi:hypothetical protein
MPGASSNRSSDNSHYLISIAASNGHVGHLYLITDDNAFLNRAYHKLCNMLDEKEISYMPIVVSTKLDKDGVSTVESFIHEQSTRRTEPAKGFKQASNLLRRVTNFHSTVFLTTANCPELTHLHGENSVVLAIEELL